VEDSLICLQLSSCAELLLLHVAHILEELVPTVPTPKPSLPSLPTVPFLSPIKRKGRAAEVMAGTANSSRDNVRGLSPVKTSSGK
jgi:hypothetical protein